MKSKSVYGYQAKFLSSRISGKKYPASSRKSIQYPDLAISNKFTLRQKNLDFEVFFKDFFGWMCSSCRHLAFFFSKNAP